MSEYPLVLAITACPTGIAHTYMAAEKLQAAAGPAGVRLRVETHGSIGVEGTFSDAEIAAADVILIAADTTVERSRFAGRPVYSTGVDEAIRDPEGLLGRALAEATTAPASPVVAGAAGGARPAAASATSRTRAVGRTLYQALMTGVSHMVPFVVTGGLLLALALSLGGQPGPEGLSIPEGSPWLTIKAIGELAFACMVPILSGYISVGIADRAGLAPGMITGLIVVHGELYGSATGAGFIGGIITGVLSGVVALGIKKIPVGKMIAPIWPTIVIPIVTTVIVGLAFIGLIGRPVAALFEALTTWLQGMDGASAVVLGAILGAMIAFDMGGPFNKTAFLFGGGLIAAGDPHPMGMVAAAIAVPPLAVGMAVWVRRAWFTRPERDAGTAALVMGFFGITEGAIPFAAARPLQVIPANILGGAVAGALAGAWGVADHVMHGGLIVAVLGAVDRTLLFFLAVFLGSAVTCATMLIGVGLSRHRAGAGSPARAAAPAEGAPAGRPAEGPAAEGESGGKPASTRPKALASVRVGCAATDQGDVIRELAGEARRLGRVSDASAIVNLIEAREAKHTTAVGGGIAIPHARGPQVTDASILFCRFDEPIDWGGERADLVFCLLVPEGSGKQHLALLSTLARGLLAPGVAERIRQAPDEDAAAEVISAVLEGRVTAP